MKRIGIVGVGKWSAQLREAFMREGCCVVAHARKSEVPHPCSGPLVSIEEMVRMEDVDFVIAAADPETTTRAVELCAEWCKPVVATKPLLRHPTVFAQPIVVDFWRLFSAPWLKFREIVKREAYRSRTTIWFEGNGPVRDFSGLLDYGQHALSFVEHLDWSVIDIGDPKFVEHSDGRTSCRIVSQSVEVIFGNGGRDRQCCVSSTLRDGQQHSFTDAEGLLTYTAPNGEKIRQEKLAALRAFASNTLATLRDCQGSFTYDYSRNAAGVLDWILAEQARHRDEPAGHPVQDPARYPVPDQR